MKKKMYGLIGLCGLFLTTGLAARDLNEKLIFTDNDGHQNVVQFTTYNEGKSKKVEVKVGPNKEALHVLQTALPYEQSVPGGLFVYCSERGLIIGMVGINQLNEVYYTSQAFREYPPAGWVPKFAGDDGTDLAIIADINFFNGSIEHISQKQDGECIQLSIKGREASSMRYPLGYLIANISVSVETGKCTAMLAQQYERIVGPDRNTYKVIDYWRYPRRR